MLFCKKCLSKNFGEECLSEAKVTGWECCCCQPSQLEHLISECDKALSGDAESSDPESDNTSGTESIDTVRYALLRFYHCIYMTTHHYFILHHTIWKNTCEDFTYLIECVKCGQQAQKKKEDKKNHG
jgi:hypothetical protein